MATPIEPEVFADFLLVQSLAVSNMAEAFVAVRLGDRSGRTFVLKRPRLGELPSGRAAQAIAREGEVLAKVAGPSIVKLEAAGEVAGLPYVAVEHVRGAPLDVLLDRSGALPRGAAAAVARDLAVALAAVHEAGFTHRDVAPSNVIIDIDGEVTLVDFGLAMPIGEAHTDLSGKPGYIAPEALHGDKAEAASDVYAWGIVVAECLLGRRLFAERDLVEAGGREHPPPAIAKLGDAAWVQRALSHDPADRPSAQELAASIDRSELDRAALSSLVSGGPPSLEARETQVSPPPKRIEPNDGKPDQRVAPATPAVVVSGDAATARRADSRRGVLTYLSVGLIGGFVGLIVGRRSARPTKGRLTIAGWLPARAEIEIDGRPVERSANGEILLDPGEHVLVVRLRNTDVRELPFTVRAGENVVLAPINLRK